VSSSQQAMMSPHGCIPCLCSCVCIIPCYACGCQQNNCTVRPVQML
jgi:hypothetical protein